MTTGITQELAVELLRLPKYIMDEEKFTKKFFYEPQEPISNDRFILMSEQNTEYSFILEIYQSPKNQLKLTLHFQEDDAKIGLLRIDYNGSRHRNPMIVEPNLPQKFHPFAGQMLEVSHIHYYVEGYKPLAWAIPLDAEPEVNVKQLKNVHSQLQNIFTNFGEMINLQTSVKIKLDKGLFDELD